MNGEYRELLGWTLEDAREVLNGWGLQAEQRDPAFEQANTMYFRLDSAGWRAAAGKLCVRYSRVCSPKVDIATLMIYPTAGADRLPILATELLVVGGSCQRVVMDIEPASEELPVAGELAKVFAPLGEKWQKVFPTDREYSEWFRAIAQPWAIHSACELMALPVLREAFRDYLGAYAAFVNAALPECPAGPDDAKVAQYKAHHADHFPGYPFLTRVLGAEWTKKFLYEYHFGVIETPEVDYASTSGVSGSFGASTVGSVGLSSSPAARAY
jgi:hypothetical protein